ncbi:calpastatin [Terrihabitans soli]|uniref:Calpastatin n=1 Tax=Terrihabitans soli TaxID=708113 RepID=A0A6S6QWZ1_9HYPH|nr:DUF1810 domain-containing protein [Terrihabitans soli]BCJ91550.1 calpastatin [Terrihabitans soli]
MTDTYNLARFVEAQERVYDAVTAELGRGQKVSHWMWFIFPQLKELGRSERALFYGISSLDEARAYLDHPVLGDRLRECTGIINKVEGRSAYEIFGPTDEMKLRSCLTLFSKISAPSVFNEVLEKYFGGTPDPETLKILAR